MIKCHADIIQGSDEWLALRCGLLTASNMKLIITPTLKAANNDSSRAHLYELLAQRITGYTEPHYISDDMLRGKVDEITARTLYHDTYADVDEVGFITNDKWGFTIGYSPDGLVGEDGLIECKSRRMKYQVQTLIENVREETIPPDYAIQIQTGLMVSERKWCDFISYSAGLHMACIRVYPIPEVQARILHAATVFEEALADRLAEYHRVIALGSRSRLHPTERNEGEQEIVL